MNCQEVRALLSIYIDKQLEQGEARRVNQHLLRCSACTSDLSVLRQTISLVGKLDEVELPIGFHDSLHRQLVAAQAAASTSWGKPMRRWVFAAAAAAAVLAIGTANVARQPEKSVSNNNPGNGQQHAGPTQEVPEVDIGTGTGTNATTTTTLPVAIGPIDPAPIPQGEQHLTLGGGTGTPPGGSATPIEGAPPAGVTNPPPLDTVNRVDPNNGNVATPTHNGTTPPAADHKWTYAAYVTATTNEPDKVMASLKAHAPGHTLVGNKFSYTVSADQWSTEKRYVQQLLGATFAIEESKSDLATQIRDGQQLVQERTTTLANFEKKAEQLTDQAEKEMASRQRAQYQQQLGEARDGLNRLLAQVDVVFIRVQLQTPAR